MWGVYGKAGNGNEMETGNGNWKRKMEMEMEIGRVQLNPGNIIFASCRSISHVSRFLFGLAAVPHSWR